MIPHPWVIIGFLVALLGAAVGGYWKGYRDADRTATIEMLKDELRRQLAEKEELRRQAEAAQTVARAAAERERETAAELQDVKGQIDDYERALAAQPSQPNCDCALSADDVRRLRGIGQDGRDQTNATGAAGDFRRPGSAPISSTGRQP